MTADHDPGLELAPFRARALDDVAHDRVVERVKDPRTDHDRRNGRKLRCRQRARKEHKGQKKVRDQGIDHVAPHGAEGEHDQVFPGLFFVFHAASSPKTKIKILYHFTKKSARARGTNSARSCVMSTFYGCSVSIFFSVSARISFRSAVSHGEKATVSCA